MNIEQILRLFKLKMLVDIPLDNNLNIIYEKLENYLKGLETYIPDGDDFSHLTFYINKNGKAMIFKDSIDGRAYIDRNFYKSIFNIFGFKYNQRDILTLLYKYISDNYNMEGTFMLETWLNMEEINIEQITEQCPI